MNKKIISIGIIGLFLLTGIFNASAFILENEHIPINSDKTISFNKDSSYKLDDLISDYNMFDKPVLTSNEIIIRFKDDPDVVISKSKDGYFITGLTSIDILNKKYEVALMEKIIKNDDNSSAFSNIFKFCISEDSDIFSVINDFNLNPYVEYAEPNYIYHTCKIPNDPLFSEQRSLDQDNDCDIDAPEAWDIETGNSNVIIAILDTGVDYNHPDLKDNCISGYDFVNDNNDPMDNDGHGTHCAGIAGAVANNSIGITGVCWDCSIMPIKIIQDNQLTTIDAIRGIEYAVRNGADIISMSWGGLFYSQALYDALYNAYTNDVFLVAAAGNNYCDWKFYPSCFDMVISVGATNGYCGIPDFSNYGNYVDVAAPGTPIYSTLPNNKYGVEAGTSMSCPHVAGLASLLLSKNPSLTNDMVKTIILSSTDELQKNPGYPERFFKNGRINAYKALQKEPAVAVFDPMPNWENCKGKINLYGKAGGTGFQSYNIEIGRGDNPVLWTSIKNSLIPINGILASLNTKQFKEGLYTLKLQVNTDQGIFISTKQIIINNYQNTLKVDNEASHQDIYTSIQNAFDNAADGDEILIKKGIYNEPLVFQKNNIKLKGEDKDKNNTILNCDHQSMYIFSDDIILTNLKINTCIHCDIIIYGNSNKIVNNYIDNLDASSTAIYLKLGSENIISDNLITSGKFGIYINSFEDGLISNNKIFNNHIKNINYGIFISDDSQSNIIYQNSFYNNIENARDYSSDTSWEYNNKGNYWDDFNLKYPDIKDENNDGIWDGPYEIPGSGNNQDNCPLVNPFENSKNIVDNSYHFYYLSQLFNRFPLLEQLFFKFIPFNKLKGLR